MTTTREAFLARVRRAVEAGNRSGSVGTIGPRGQTGYQGAGDDPVGWFCTELTAAGGFPYAVADADAAVAKTLALVRDKAPRRVLLGSGSFLDSLNLCNHLTTQGIEVSKADKLAADSRDILFAVDLGISSPDYLIAETGSLICIAKPEEPRSLSLLPPVHIVIANRAQLLPDLFDLFDLLPAMPSCVSIITGPSKTGDIELKLVTGVHGPGEVHVVLINDEPPKRTHQSPER